MAEEKLKNNTKIGVVIAMEKEAKEILNTYEFAPIHSVCDKKVYQKDNIILIISGIGKVNAGISTQLLIDKYGVDKVLNLGTCGGLDSAMNVGELYNVEKCFQYDFDLSEIDEVSVGYMQDYDRIYFECTKLNCPFIKLGGVLGSGDRFTNGERDITTIQKLNGNLRDMEGAGVAQACLSNKVDCYMVKGLTDVYGKKDVSKQYYENVNEVCKKLSDHFLEMIACIK